MVLKILKTFIYKKVNRNVEMTFSLNRKFFNCLTLDTIKTSSSYFFEVTPKKDSN